MSTLFLSPWFGLSLVLAGILYVVFIPQERQFTKNVWIAGCAASIACLLSLLALWSVFVGLVKPLLKEILK